MSGWVIAGFGVGGVYLLNALSFLAVLYALLVMGPVSQQVAPDRQAGVSLQSIREGVQFIVTHPIILSTMILDFFATFFSSANNLMPVVALDVLKVGEVAYGWLYSAQGLGAVLAALVVSQMSRIRNQGPVFLVSVVIFGLATVAFGMAPSFILALLALMVMGAANSVSTIIRNTIRQLQTPDYIRGRMTSINQIFFMGGPQLGEVEAGVVAQLFGAPAAIISGGAACILAVAWISRRWPQLRSYRGEEPVPASATAD